MTADAAAGRTETRGTLTLINPYEYLYHRSRPSTCIREREVRVLPLAGLAILGMGISAEARRDDLVADLA